MADSKNARLAAAAPIILRLALGSVFLYHGAQKLGLLEGGFAWEVTRACVERFALVLAQHGVEPSRPLAWAAAVAQLLGGGFVLLGFVTPGACAAVVACMALSVSSSWEYRTVAIAAALALACTGPGTLSLDAAFGIFNHRGGKKP